MCLFYAKKVTTEKDITVYKVLCVRKPFKWEISNCEEYHSPYHKETTWALSERKDLEFPDAEIYTQMFRDSPQFDRVVMVEGNAFHSFRDCEAAANEVLRLKRDSPDETFVVGEFIIPKDCRYIYEGYYSYATSYASSSLIFYRLCGTTPKD